MKPLASSTLAIPLSMAGVGSMFVVFIFALSSSDATPLGTPGNPFGSGHDLKKFYSYDEMVSFLARAQSYITQLDANRQLYFANSGLPTMGPVPSTNAPAAAQQFASGSAVQGAPAAESNPALLSPVTSSFSTTNIQVSGVDEPDFLKNDGKYVYILSGDKLTIVKGYPAKEASVEAKVSLDVPEGQSLQNMFLYGDRLVIFYEGQGQVGAADNTDGSIQPLHSQQVTHMLIVDVSDRTNPKELRNFDVSGSYNTARMIGSQVILLTLGQVDYQHPVKPSIQDQNKATVSSPDVYYFDDPQQSYSFNTVSVVDLSSVAGENKTANAILSKTFMIGSGATVYVSDKSMYIAYQDFSYPLPLSSSGASGHSLPAIRPAGDSTIIHKISIAGNTVLQYEGKAQVPGHLLNEFSMGEQGGRFSVATTSDLPAYGAGMQNNVYTFDSKMSLVGKLEGLEQGESIYAARFMGDKLYLVTFQRLDPFLVIDLSHDQPQVLGKLQLPGYSNYLQPYDDSHIIGIGRDAVPNPMEDGAARPMGLKVALFDVSDLSNPKVIDTYSFGNYQTNSEALNDHKALLFDKERNILSMPVSSFGDNVGQNIPWTGFYVFGISPSEGVKLKATIDHGSSGSQYYGQQGGRSFFINDTLYTVSSNVMKMNELADPNHELNSINLTGSGQIIKPIL